MNIATYYGLFIKRQWNEEPDLRNIGYDLIKSENGKYSMKFHSIFENGIDIFPEPIKNEYKFTIHIMVFTEYIGPQLNLIHPQFKSIFNKSKNKMEKYDENTLHLLQTNVKIFFDKDFPLKNILEMYLTKLGFVISHKMTDRFICKYIENSILTKIGHFPRDYSKSPLL